ncbi:MAG: helical backbone metal receptor [Thermoguttaceae bacterium]|nr:helical backbone metal receptor [Thermoguttaceae bacterium]
MRTKLLLGAILATVIVGTYAGKAMLRRPDRGAPPETLAGPDTGPTAEAVSGAREAGQGPRYRRIVSLSPSITETLFALGLGDRVVGVTRFCQYPPEAQTRTKVGGYLDPNYEAIVALEPDLVVLRGEKAEYVDGFKALGLEVLAVRHQSVDDILAAIRTIGRACGVQDRADRLAADLEERMRRLRERTAGLKRPRVLLVVERTLGTVQGVYVAGGDGFLNATIELAGGENACPKTSVGAPVVSADGIVQMDPEVIVELTPKERLAGRSDQEVLADWRQLPDLAAVRAGRVYLVADEGILVPGPRFPRLAERLARLIHPEVAW